MPLSFDEETDKVIDRGFIVVVPDQENMLKVSLFVTLLIFLLFFYSLDIFTCTLSENSLLYMKSYLLPWNAFKRLL